MTGDRHWNEPDVVTKLGPWIVAVTVSRLTDLVRAKRVKVFAAIDQSVEARQVGLELRNTTLVIFRSPAAGTLVMAASPLSALDLPLKVLVWADAGRTMASYYMPAALAARHHVGTDLQQSSRASICSGTR